MPVHVLKTTTTAMTPNRVMGRHHTYVHLYHAPPHLTPPHPAPPCLPFQPSFVTLRSLALDLLYLPYRRLRLIMIFVPPREIARLVHSGYGNEKRGITGLGIGWGKAYRINNTNERCTPRAPLLHRNGPTP